MSKIFASQESYFAHKSPLTAFYSKKVLMPAHFGLFVWWGQWLKPLFATLSTGSRPQNA